MTVRAADTIVVMNQGELAEKGSHEELMEEGGIYASLVERQNSGVECRSFEMGPTANESVRPRTTYVSCGFMSSKLCRVGVVL